jgi:hypothetical protein
MINEVTVLDAIKSINPNAEVFVTTSLDGGDVHIEWLNGTSEIPMSDINAKKAELENKLPLKVLRNERNLKLSETDWWCCSDRTPTQAQLDYRTALRDLPSTASPSLDKNGNLTGVTWPTKPE